MTNMQDLFNSSS